MTDQVLIEALRVDTVIGVYEWEKTIQQTLVIDVVMDCDNRPAAEQDNIDLAVDYARVSDAITELLQAQPRQLIETVAEDIAKLVLQQFAVRQVQVKVAKPDAVAAAQQVAVRISRQANEYQ